MSACEVHHVADGPPDAPLVVLSGSLGSTAAMWEAQVAALSEAHRVVRYDHRGHGMSPVPDGPYEIADLGADVIALLDRLGVERASFCGASMGGMVGMWLASHAPQRIDRLVVCCSSAHLPPAEVWADRAASVRAAGSARVVADTMVERWFTPGFAALNPGVIDATRAMIAATPAEGYAACCGAIERMDLRADLAAITAPTLVIAGAQDPSTPPDHGERIAGAIAGARLEILSPAAHIPGIEQADAVNRLVLGHLAAAPR